MEILFSLTVLVLLIFVYNKVNRNISVQQMRFDKLEGKLNSLIEQISKQKESSDMEQAFSSESSISVSETEISEDFSAVEEVYAEENEVSSSGSFETEEVFAQEKVLNVLEEEGEQKDSGEVFLSTFKEVVPPKLPVPPTPRVSWFSKFREKNPDIEKFIGENLINKIGILILVLGVSFFVKYAIDRDWINEPARVGIGILAGVIVMGIAHKLRKNYGAFSSVFVSGAISIFYFTIGIAFRDYGLFSQSTAFAIMVVITLFSTAISILYNRKELAVLSLLGGFAVPFMVSTGEENYKVLFSYISILNVGMLILAYYKRWNIVTILAFVFTFILYSSWVATKYESLTFPNVGALIYATLFYVIFSVAAVIGSVRKKGDFGKWEYFIMLANTFSYFSIGAILIDDGFPRYKGLFTIALAMCNLLFAVLLFRKFGIHRKSVYFLLGISLTFVTLTIPFQFDGNHITLFWAAEAVLLLWLFQKSKISTFKIGAIIIQGLMLVSLIMDWWSAYLYSANYFPIIFNKIFITGIFVIVSFVLSYSLLGKEREKTLFYFVEINPVLHRKFCLIISVCLGYFVGLIEAMSIESNLSEKFYTRHGIVPMAYHFVFTAILIFFWNKKLSNSKAIWAVVLGLFNLLLYTTVVYYYPIEELYDGLLLNLDTKFAFFLHYLFLFCVVYYLFVLIKIKRTQKASFFTHRKISPWIFIFFVVYVLSVELLVHGVVFFNTVDQADLLRRSPIVKGSGYDGFSEKKSFLLASIHETKIQIIKIAYPILWGMLSFVFLIYGIKKQDKLLRIISLSLLGVTILKLFLYDIKNVSETGKIIAFILLGVLILVISFVYQKIKKLVVDEPENKKK